MRNLKSWKSVENGILRCTELICETLCWNLDLSRNQYGDSMSAVSVKMLEWKVLVLPVLTGRVREILVGFKTGDLGERHPGQVIFIGAAPIIFCSRTALAVRQAGYVVAQRIIFFMCEVSMVRKEGKSGEV